MHNLSGHAVSSHATFFHSTSLHSIGVFDSGIGGLTVVRELFESVPHERIVYFGDTARVPYGTRSVETVQRYAREDTELLLAHDVRLIVIACNTVSAVALDEVIALAQDIPVIGMIEPATHEALRKTKNGKIGVIGTPATVASAAYDRAITALATREGRSVHVESAACPLFVPLAEEGWMHHKATELIAREYLQPLVDHEIDTLILGCTHYPVLEETIRNVMGDHITLINSGAVAAREVERWVIQTNEPTAASTTQPDHLMLVSDVPGKFQTVGERFLGRTLPTVRQVVFKESWVVRRETAV